MVHEHESQTFFAHTCAEDFGLLGEENWLGAARREARRETHTTRGPLVLGAMLGAKFM